VVTTGNGQKPSTRVSLVIAAPRNLTDTSPTGIAPIDGLRAAAKEVGLRTTVLYGGDSLSGFLQKIKAAARTSGLVIVGATSNLEAVSKLTRQYPETRFLVVGSVFDKRASFAGQKNVTGLNFNDYENGYLGGYLAGLMTHGNKKVSAVGDTPTEAERALITGFKAGARLARPQIGVLVDYAGTSFSPAPCESAVNRQIDRGSAVIFDATGDCGFAALQAAVTFRGVWGIGADSGDLSYLGPKILGSVIERTDRATQRAVTLFASGQLPRGGDLRFSLASGDIGLVGISGRVPKAVLSKVERVYEQLRARDNARDSR
jgi:basic membrane protein A